MTGPNTPDLPEDLSLRFHASQRPGRVRARLSEALEQRSLPARFLYDSPAQAARWLAYHAAWSPSRTEEELIDLYQRAFRSTLGRFESPDLVHVSLGCGGGRKDALLAEAAQLRRLPLRAVLSDTSPSLVMEAMSAHPGSAEGLVIDLESSPSRAAFTRAHPALWTAFGMVPNLDADRFLGWLAGCLGPDDRALVSANLHSKPWPDAGEDILPQYDNPEARAWYLGALAELGFGEAEVRVRGRARSPDGAAWRVEVEARSHQPGRLLAFDREFPVEAGSTFSVFFSNRFTPAAFEKTLVAAGLHPLERWRFAGDEEGLWLVGRLPDV
ncbi:MAG: L-histidine N(alpha)-methyltransferase [Myxococcota bacterium]